MTTDVATKVPAFTVEPNRLTRSVKVSRDRHFEVELIRGLNVGETFPLTGRLANRSGLIVTTPTVASLYGQNLTECLRAAGTDLPMVIVNCTEQTKSLEQVQYICAQAYHYGLDRKSILIALGGGICSDLVTMAASWIRRGIGTIRLPTTLIGQIDAAIGIKGAVNFEGKKSALGCFYPPEAVLVDSSFLHTLTQQHLRYGFAEILKMALIRDAELFSMIERVGSHLIRTHFRSDIPEKETLLWFAITNMLEELETNFYEDRSFLRVVDFGHIFSPFIEARTGYYVPHGEAVAIDMAFSCVLAHCLDLLSHDELNWILTSFEELGLSVNHPVLDEDLVSCALSESMAHRGGHVNLVLPTGIGRAVFLTEQHQLNRSSILTALSEIKTLRTSTWSEVRLNEPFAPLKQLRAHTETTCLVFDIGGTHLRCGYYDSVSQTLAGMVHRETTNCWNVASNSITEIYEILINTMKQMASELLGKRKPSQVSVAFPGPIDGSGKVISAPTIWGRAPASPIDMAKDLRRLWPDARVHVLNDVSAAGYRYCNGEGRDNFCILTVSSGIGNKIFLDGKPYVGPANRGGEIGHLQVDERDDALVCDCGERGHLGGISSGRGTLSVVRQLVRAQPETFRTSVLFGLVSDPDAITNEHIVSAFHKRDAFVLQSVRKTAKPLAAALAAMHAALGLERFILIGGFATAMGEPYRRELADLASHCCWSIGQDWGHMLRLGHPDNLSGLIGAGRYACEFAPETEHQQCG